MAFNFSEIKTQKAAIVAQGTPKLICLVAPRGYGKSSAIGTLPKDKNVLILMTTAENHSYISARGLAIKTHGTADHLTPFFLDKAQDGKAITGDAVVGRLIELLTDPDTIKFFPAIALDSLAALDCHVLACSDLVAADKFSTGKVANAIYARIFNAIKSYVEKGGIFIYTLPSESYTDDKGVTVTTPKLRGSAAITSVLGETPIIVRLEKITSEDTEGKTHTDYCFCFKGGELTKKKAKVISMTGSGKDMKIHSVPVTLNFACRIAGIPSDYTPDIMDANLSDLLDLIDRGGNKEEQQNG